MQEALKRIPQVITEPVAAFQALRERPAILVSIVLYLISDAALSLVSYEFDPSGWMGFPDATEPISVEPSWTVRGAILNLIGIVIGVALIRLAGKLLGGSGTFQGLFTTSAFALVPTVLQAPAYLLSTALGASDVDMVSYTAVMIWSLVLGVLAIRETERVSTGRAVGILVLAIGVPFGALVLLGVIVGVALAPFLG